MFTKQTIDCLTDNIVEILKVSLIEWLSDNKIYERNNWNDDFDDLTFDGDERLIDRRQLYSINDDIVFRLIKGSSIHV